jgi:ABC-type uncharacterized transport system permease subunit
MLWYAVGLIAAIAVGWLAAVVHGAGHAPIGILSLAVGIALGIILCRIAATLRVAGSPRLVVGAILLALVTVLAQHAWLYHSFRQQWHKARTESAEVAMFRPETPWSPSEYFSRELTPQRAALWCVDAALITAAAVGTVVLLDRKRQ